MLDNRNSNSNADDRVALLKICMALLGKDRIGLVVDDRDFVGHAWLKWFKDNALNFIMRLPKHHGLTHPDSQRPAVTDLGRHGLNLLHQLARPLTLPEDPLARLVKTLLT